MSLNKIMTSSEDMKWATRYETFNSLQEQLGRVYNVDPCCEPHTAKCDTYITEEDDLFTVDSIKDHTGLSNVSMFVNPPYGREQRKFVTKIVSLCNEENVTADVLIPARTDTILFHDIILKHASCVRFIRGRIVFGTDTYWESLWAQKEIDGKPNKLYGKVGRANPAPFACMLVTFGRPEEAFFKTLTSPSFKYTGTMLP